MTPKLINYDLHDREVTENMWLWRQRQPSRRGTPGRRPRAVMSQIEAAARLNLTPQQYASLERGESTLVTAADLVTLCGHALWAGFEPGIGELCALARRRSGLTIKEVTAMLDMSPHNYMKAEEAGAAAIRLFWIDQGFRFARKLVRPGSKVASHASL